MASSVMLLYTFGDYKVHDQLFFFKFSFFQNALNMKNLVNYKVLLILTRERSNNCTT